MSEEHNETALVLSAEVFLHNASHKISAYASSCTAEGFGSRRLLVIDVAVIQNRLIPEAIFFKMNLTRVSGYDLSGPAGRGSVIVRLWISG